MSRRDRDQGFTLVEVLIAVVVSGMMISGLVGALATSFSVFSNSVDNVEQTSAAEGVTTLWIQDAQSAGGIDVATSETDPTLGISLTDAAGCAAPGTLVVRFSWLDPVDRGRRVASYVTTPTNEVIRRSCVAGRSTTDAIVGTSVLSAVAACTPVANCTGAPTSISMTMSGSGPHPFSYALKATVRSRPPIIPAPSAPSVTFTVFGAGKDDGCPSVSVGSRSIVTVVGEVVAAPTTCKNGPIGGTPANLKATKIKTVATLADPLAELVPPTFNCAGTAADPTPVGKNFGSPTVYRKRVTISADTVFEPGDYVFCLGLNVQENARVTGTGVLLYLTGASSQLRGEIDLAPPSTGPRQNVAIWVGSAQLTISVGDEVDSIRGIIYSPTRQLSFELGQAMNVGAMVAGSVQFQGTGTLRVGVVPKLSVNPVTLPAGGSGAPYPVTTMVAAGGTGPYTWSAKGLPSGLTLDSASGRLSGTPNDTGTSNVIITAVDATTAAVSVRLSISITAPPEITEALLPNWSVNSGLITPALTATKGAAPYAWTATGLPPGLAMDASNGSLVGTPNLAGTYKFDVQVTDAVGSSAHRTFSITINPSPTIPVVGYTMKQNRNFSNVVVVVGGTPNYTWYSSDAPAWVTLNPTGTISGRAPAGAQKVVFTVGIVDAAGAIVDATVITLDIA
jgi:prepilin-type N-terminal cleavage/methylation domain-containing protein